MNFRRSSGIQLHPTSLPGDTGIGDLGASARLFADFLASAGQTVWQVLPLGPTGYADSPYQCFSALAGNPLLISCGTHRADFPEDHVDYARVIPWKLGVLDALAADFRESASPIERRGFESFCERHALWLDDFALFMALKRRYPTGIWTQWPEPVRKRDTATLQRLRAELAPEIETQKFLQYRFFSQWSDLRSYCRDRRIRIMGDVPIYVAHDSVDVWVNPHYFQLDSNGNPDVVAGVPPDYFSATGQLWGNPIYNWSAMESDGFTWWIHRFRAVLELVDMVRLDHFRGFEAYWEIAAGETTAEHGRWVKGPGSRLFNALVDKLGQLPLVAENLGVITPEVEALRAEFGLPGMAILQFAFGKDPQAHTFRPHNYPRHLVAYSGTHDNDTTVGWWTSKGRGESTRTEEDIRREREFTMHYLNMNDDPVNWVFIRALESSVADTVLIPMQDVLGLGSEARMNQPATTSGNWRWRCRRESFTPELANRLKDLTELYERC